MPLAGFEPTIPVFKRAKTFHALDRGATVTNTVFFTTPQFIIIIIVVVSKTCSMARGSKRANCTHRRPSRRKASAVGRGGIWSRRARLVNYWADVERGVWGAKIWLVGPASLKTPSWLALLWIECLVFVSLCAIDLICQFFQTVAQFAPWLNYIRHFPL
jgi:hypothetical protein